MFAFAILLPLVFISLLFLSHSSVENIQKQVEDLNRVRRLREGYLKFRSNPKVIRKNATIQEDFGPLLNIRRNGKTQNIVNTKLHRRLLKLRLQALVRQQFDRIRLRERQPVFFSANNWRRRGKKVAKLGRCVGISKRKPVSKNIDYMSPVSPFQSRRYRGNIYASNIIGRFKSKINSKNPYSGNSGRSTSIPVPQKPQEELSKIHVIRTPNEKLELCCAKQRVSPNCQQMCNFDRFTNESVITAILTNQCPDAELGLAFDCISSKVDHTQCCRKNNVHLHLQGECLSFCRVQNGIEIDSLQSINCLPIFDQIKACYFDRLNQHSKLFS